MAAIRRTSIDAGGAEVLTGSGDGGAQVGFGEACWGSRWIVLYALAKPETSRRQLMMGSSLVAHDAESIGSCELRSLTYAGRG